VGDVSFIWGEKFFFFLVKISLKSGDSWGGIRGNKEIGS